LSKVAGQGFEGDDYEKTDGNEISSHAERYIRLNDLFKKLADGRGGTEPRRSRCPKALPLSRYIIKCRPGAAGELPAPQELMARKFHEAPPGEHSPWWKVRICGANEMMNSNEPHMAYRLGRSTERPANPSDYVRPGRRRISAATRWWRPHAVAACH
jgi:hypothetical protein